MVFIILAVILYGLTHPLGALLVEKLDPMVFVFHYLAIRLLCQLPLVSLRAKEAINAFKSPGAKYIWSAGLIGTFLHWSEFSALQIGLPISHITFITYLAPAWLVLFEYISRRGDYRHIIKCSLTLVGGIILITPHAQGNFSFKYILPVLSSILIASWIENSKRARESGLHPTVYSFYYDLLALIGVGIGLLLSGKMELALTMPPKLGGLIIFSMIVGVLPNLLLFIGLKNQESLSASLILSLEPVFSGAVSIILHEEMLTLSFLIGASLIFISNLPNEILPAFLKKRRKV